MSTGGPKEEHSAHSLYEQWYTMRNRCRNPRNPKYPRYGGRGINVGPKPSPQHSLDRIDKVCERWNASFQAFKADNDGNYEPGNVWWATPVAAEHQHVGLSPHHSQRCTDEPAGSVGVDG